MNPGGIRYAWYVVTLLAIASMFSFLDRTILNLLVEPIKASLGIDDVQISLLQGLAFALFYAIAGLPLARIADRYNRVRLIGVGIALWSAATVSCGLAGNYWQLFLARVGVGVGEAALVPAAASLLVDYFPRRLLARANSVFVLGSAVGGGIAMLGGSSLLAAFSGVNVTVPLLGPLADWQLAFVIVGLPGLVLALLVLVTMREPARIGLQAGGRAERTSLSDFAKAHRSTLLALVFSYPLAGAAFSGWLAWFPTYLIRGLEQSPASAAAWMGILIATVGVGGTIAGGVLADRRLTSGRPARLVHLAAVCIGGLAFFGTLGPLSGTLPGALASFATVIFLGSVLSVLPILSLQLITPADLRARTVAYYLFLGTILSAAAGPTVVALLAQHVLAGPQAIGQALSLASVLLGGTATIVLMLGRRPYARSLDAGSATTPAADSTASPVAEELASTPDQRA
jgi:MFS family permease